MSSALEQTAFTCGKRAQQIGIACAPGYDSSLGMLIGNLPFESPERAACLDAWYRGWRESMLAGPVKLSPQQREVLAKAGRFGMVSRGIRSYADGRWHKNDATVNAGVAGRLVEMGLLSGKGYYSYVINDAGRQILERLDREG